MNTKLSKKNFADLLGCDISDIVFDTFKVTTYNRDEEGNVIMAGPSFAQTPLMTEHTILLVEAGRPVGTTVANGAAPKTSKK